MFGILNLQSAYNMLKNTLPLPVLIEHAKLRGYDVVSLSDQNLHGMIELFQEAKKHQIKPVLGLSIAVSSDLVDTVFLTYVKDQTGYKNLMQLALKQSEHQLDDQFLFQHQEGLIFVTAGIHSSIHQAILKDDLDLAFSLLKHYEQHIDHLYLGLSLDTLVEEMKIAPKLFLLSERTGIKMLPLHQTSYLNPEDKEVYEALIKIDSEDHVMPEDADYSLKTKDDIQAMFQDYPYVFDTLSDVFNSIGFIWNPITFDMPDYPLKEGTPHDYLHSLATIGLKKRLKKIQNPDEKIYQERLLYELKMIERMGYENYFLIVYDFVKYAKTHDILVGPGRGSAAGSLVAYCLGITDVDPIQYDLLFERFLNPERITMPDIDMDFPDNKRDEVLRYVKDKYGINHTVSIVTFGTFALRSSIRDIARVMNIDPSRVTGIINRVIHEDIDETDAEMMRLLKVAKKIEGLPRHTGTHAAGIILSKQNLLDFIPLQKGQNDFYQTQLEASELEKLGLLKIDFLGIRNLAVIDEVIKLIHTNGREFKLQDLDLNDKKTYDLLSSAQTTGVFQLESQGMRNVLRKLKPTVFEDIIALLALYRPGPMDHIDEYIARRNGKPFSYLHPDLEPILKNTYGIIVYQEQIMKIASEYAGYTLAEADLLRRGIGKKDKDILESERLRFIEKSKRQGYLAEDAETIYDLIVKFADYGFNRSHSVAYALVAYQMAYLKANYFPIFMSTLLSSVTGNEGLTRDYIIEMRQHGVSVLPPDINRSTDQYIYENNHVFMPLLAIKSIGRQAMQKIMAERELGPFVNFQNLKGRLKKDINEKNLEMLIDSGALDQMNLSHRSMIQYKDLSHAGYEQFITDFTMEDLPEFSFQELSKREKEALGMNIKYHPLVMHADYIQKHHLYSLSHIQSLEQGYVLAQRKQMKTIKTKNGDMMAFVELDDGITQLETTIFPNVYQRIFQKLNDEVNVYRLTKNIYRGQVNWLIEQVIDLVTFDKEKK